LEEGAKLVIITPYRNPKKYKDEIEKHIKELLDMGDIREEEYQGVLGQMEGFSHRGCYLGK
jgi:hypothetical protein